MTYCIQGVRPYHMPEIFNFSRDVVGIFREELNCPNMDIVFEPRQPRQGPGVPSDRDHWSFYPGRFGAWQIVVWAHTYDQDRLGGALMGWMNPVPHVVEVCDGRGGLPLIPGRWLIPILDSKDRGKHGTRELERRKDAVSRDMFLRAHRAGDKTFVEKWRRNADLYKLLRDMGRDRGLVAPSTAEVISMEKDAEAKKAEMDAALERHAIEETTWGTTTPDVG